MRNGYIYLMQRNNQFLIKMSYVVLTLSCRYTGSDVMMYDTGLVTFIE